MIRRLLNKIETIFKYRYFSKIESGPYKFLLQKVHKSTDIDFIEKIFQLDFFRETLVTQELDLSNIKNVLVLAPHQDDEVIGCGGTLDAFYKFGCNITIGFLTDGEELSNPINSINTRSKEADKVCKSINATKIDFNINNLSMEVSSDTMKKLINLFNNEWDYIFTVWPLDNPPKHRLCSYLIGKALNNSNYNGNICLYAVHTDLIPNIYVDISKHIEAKRSLIRTYVSQLEHQNYEHLSIGLDAWRTRFLPNSSKDRYIEAFTMIPSEAYQDFQTIYEQVNLNQLFKSHENCIKSFKKLNKLM